MESSALERNGLRLPKGLEKIGTEEIGPECMGTERLFMTV